MGKGIVFTVAAATLVSGWIVYSKVAQVRRESAYNAAILPFQHDLPAGMSRGDVEKYLDSRKLEYHWEYYGSGGGKAESYVIEIGEEPAVSCAILGEFTLRWTSIRPVTWEKLMRELSLIQPIA